MKPNHKDFGMVGALAQYERATWNAAIEAAAKACEALKRPIIATEAAELCRNDDLDDAAKTIRRLKR